MNKYEDRLLLTLFGVLIACMVMYIVVVVFCIFPLLGGNL